MRPHFVHTENDVREKKEMMKNCEPDLSLAKKNENTLNGKNDEGERKRKKHWSDDFNFIAG